MSSELSSDHSLVYFDRDYDEMQKMIENLQYKLQQAQERLSETEQKRQKGGMDLRNVRWSVSLAVSDSYRENEPSQSLLSNPFNERVLSLSKLTHCVELPSFLCIGGNYTSNCKGWKRIVHFGVQRGGICLRCERAPTSHVDESRC